MIALYARVSTKGHDQDPETQLGILRAWAERQGRTDYATYVDYASGKDLKRPAWERMAKTWRTGVIDTVAVLRLDRAFRSVSDMHSVFAELEGRGIRFAAVTQEIDISTPVGKLLVNVLGSVAEFERDLIIERVREGLERAKREGKKLGRPRKVSDRRLLATLKHTGSIRAAARALSVSPGTLSRRVRKTPAGFELVGSN
jgi:DNA invertase Pin-like site-specific DNA recombinase